MMVAIPRRAEGRRLTDTERGLLVPMVTRSDNDTASAIYGRIGDRGLNAVARVAGMRKFTPSSVWGNSQITAADQVRFFIQIDELVPPAHRRYARKLLSSIVKPQRWAYPWWPGRKASRRSSRAGGGPVIGTRSPCWSAAAAASRSPCSPRGHRRRSTATRRSRASRSASCGGLRAEAQLTRCSPAFSSLSRSCCSSSALGSKVLMSGSACRDSRPKSFSNNGLVR